MNTELESFLDDLAGTLKKAAESAVWDVPMNHRTKDSISAYRAAVGMVSACVRDVLDKHRAPAAVTSEDKTSVSTQMAAPEKVDEETADPAQAPMGTSENAVSDLLAGDQEPVGLDIGQETMFHDGVDKPRRRRSGDRNGSQ